MSKLSSDLQPMGYASFMHRTHAFFMDCLIFFPLSALAENNLFETKNFNIVVLIALAWLIYKPVMEWKYGATLGKMIARIRVVDHKMNFPSFNQAMMRFTPFFAISLSMLISNYALFNLDGFQSAKSLEDIQQLQTQLPTGGVFLSFLFFAYSVGKMFFNDKKQTFHDEISQTSCILVQKVIPTDDSEEKSYWDS